MPDSESGWELARADIERLEEGLAAATHQRDLAEERARLAGEGVEGLERRLERLERRLERLQLDRERAEAEAERAERERAAATEAAERSSEENGRLEQEVAAARSRLEAREEHLSNAQAGIESRDRRLEAAESSLEARRKELEDAVASREAERAELAAARSRLELREEELERERAVAREAAELSREEIGHLRAEIDAGRERLKARERELEDRLRAVEQQRDEATTRLEAREKHLETAQLGIESRDRRLAAAQRNLEARDAELASRDAELASFRTTAGDRERSLALAEARLEKAQQRSEHFEASLDSIRQGRSYRFMRVLWRLRRPFRRAPRRPAAQGIDADEEADPAGAAAPAAPPVAAAESPPAAEPPPVPAKSSPAAAPSPPAGDRLRVASILDEMSEACFAPECDLVPLPLEGWQEQLDGHRPDLLLVESAWNANGGEWQYRIAQYPRKDLVGLPALRALLDGCRERGIPTAFWNKEDPVHFERFEEAAALFDHVFTTDARCVDRYRALPAEGTRQRTVAPLPFAAQPRIHNPAAAVPERSNSPCFAGAWYRDRHPDRRRSLEALLDAARPRGLVIYDRRFGTDDGAFGFPERFAPHVLGKLPYERILDVYKSHHVFLNANSVAESPTMCSRRVFELAACDTAILSTPGAALAALLGEGMVAEAGDEASAAAALERLLGDEQERRRRTRAARRAVFAAHTYADRLRTIATTAGLSAPPPNGDAWGLLVQPGVELSDQARADLRAAAVYAEADAIGVHPGNGAAPLEHRQVDDLDPRALLLRRELIEQCGNLTDAPEQIHAQLRRWSDDGVRLYAADADLLSLSETRAVSV